MSEALTAPGAVPLLTTALVLVIAVCLVVVLYRDVRRFEIHFEALALACGASLALIVLREGPNAALEALATAATLGLLTDLVRRLRPGRMGAGDPWAFAALGLAGGPDHILPALIAAALFSLLAALAYAHARGKRLFRSMFPAAVALVPATALAVALRLAEAPEDPTHALPVFTERLAVGLSAWTAPGAVPVSVPVSALVSVCVPAAVLAGLLAGVFIHRRSKQKRSVR